MCRVLPSSFVPFPSSAGLVAPAAYSYSSEASCTYLYLDNIGRRDGQWKRTCTCLDGTCDNMILGRCCRPGLGSRTEMTPKTSLLNFLTHLPSINFDHPPPWQHVMTAPSSSLLPHRSTYLACSSHSLLCSPGPIPSHIPRAALSCREAKQGRQAVGQSVRMVGVHCKSNNTRVCLLASFLHQAKDHPASCPRGRRFQSANNGQDHARRNTSAIHSSSSLSGPLGSIR
ncbi:hypothetical protein B0T11DRAFT_108279 [Plectosphaerella cucumerina]|uniref:Uncharacterized protein n=1 Tax=Plectosphaerella cucumerina TaxID=40658 RepID=A0A8K0X3H5_9PEZI|nr:hypothetical protein B0T11DRAFT_108279 [Plectosphaerella cucumerina]